MQKGTMNWSYRIEDISEFFVDIQRYILINYFKSILYYRATGPAPMSNIIAAKKSARKLTKAQQAR